MGGARGFSRTSNIIAGYPWSLLSVAGRVVPTGITSETTMTPLPKIIVIRVSSQSTPLGR